MTSLNVGVIGVGNMGYHHARVYASSPQVKLASVCDVDRRRGLEVARKFDCRFYADYREMLEQEKLDAISLVVPTRMHHSIGKEVVSSGVHALVEKPLAMSVQEGWDLVKSAEKAGVILAVGHVERYNPAVLEIAKVIREGSLGQIVSIVAKRLGMTPPRTLDTNVVLDLAIHDIDVINFLLGKEPEEIMATAGSAVFRNTFDHVEIFLRYGEIGCFVQANWVTSIKIRRLAVTGNKGYAELNYVTQKLQLFQTKLELEYVDFGDFVSKFGKPESSRIRVKVAEPLRKEIESFLSAVRGEEVSLVSGYEGLKALEVVEKVLSHLHLKKT